MNDLYLCYNLNRCLILYDNSMTINKIYVITLVVWKERDSRESYPKKLLNNQININQTSKQDENTSKQDF